MISPATPANETERLRELYRLELLDTPYEKEFDELVQLASQICNTPMSLISLIDRDRQWFKARKGLDLPGTPRDVSFCAHAILGSGCFVVNDTQDDARFVDNPLVTGDPHLRFYAGVPLTTESGHNLGTICILDTVPRDLTPEHEQALTMLSRLAMKLFEGRIRNKLLHQKQQRLEELSRTQSRIISIVSHDVRNPLGSLRSMLDMMEAGLLEADEMAEMLAVGKRQVDSTTEMLNNLVDWGSVQLQNRPPEKRLVNLHDLVTSKFATFQVASRLKANRLVNNVPVDFTLESDENALRFVLRNLVSNAMKFTENGSICVSAYRGEDGRAHVLVQDTGTGITESVRSRLFDAHHRQSAPGTQLEKGSGLGLVLVKEYLDKLGGSVTVRSELGRGTEVEVVL